MNIKEQRKAFEEWFKTTQFYKNMVKSLSDNDFKGGALDMNQCEYRSIYVQLAFDSWLSSSNREGFKLVPVEATDYMKCSVRDFDPDIEEYANMDKFEWEELCGDIYKTMLEVYNEK